MVSFFSQKKKKEVIAFSNGGMQKIEYILRTLRHVKEGVMFDPSGVLFVRDLGALFDNIINVAVHSVVFHACTPDVFYLKRMRKVLKKIDHYIFSDSVDLPVVLVSEVLEGISKLTIIQPARPYILDAKFNDLAFQRCKISELNIFGARLPLCNLYKYIQQNKHLKCIRLFGVEIADWYPLACAVENTSLLEFTTDNKMTPVSLQMFRDAFGYEQEMTDGVIAPKAKTSTDHISEIIVLVQSGNVKGLRAMKPLPDANTRASDGDTLLHIAVKNKDIEMVKYIMNLPSLDLTAKNHANKSAVDYAEGEILDLMLKNVSKGMVPISSEEENTDLQDFSSYWQVENSSEKDWLGRTKRFGLKRSWNGRGPDDEMNGYFYNLESFYRAIVDSDPKPNQPYEERKMKLEKVKQILKTNPGIVNARIGPDHFTTALCFACASDNRVELFDLLMSTEGIDINAVMKSNITPFMIATDRGNTYAIRKLLKAGCDLSKITTKNADELMWFDFMSK